MLFKEVIGQEDIKQQLLFSLKSGRIGHALLFSGKTGYGTLALALAYVQYLFCTNPQEGDACGVCPSCKKMQKLIHPDLHLVFPVVKISSSKKSVSDDYIKEWRSMFLKNAYPEEDVWRNAMGATENAQSLIYTEESSNILKKLSLKSFESDYKAVIIWLPEKMRSEGGNKLLKILEEPYPKTIFILVSEQPDSLLGTILSRTQRKVIPPLNNDDIHNQLIKDFNVTEQAASDITHIARGNWSIALKNIEESEQAIYNQERFVKLMRLCWERKMPAVNEFVDNLASQGREGQKNFLSYSIRMIRESFIRNFGIDKIVYMNQQEKMFAKKFSPYIHEANVIILHDEFEKAHHDIIRNGNSKIVFTDLCIKVMQNIRPSKS